MRSDMMFYVVLLSMVALAHGHGRMIEPGSRASAWRYGWNTPINYNDNQLFCGGFFEQSKADGKCGVCGDPYDLALNDGGIRPNEAGGMYATGTITAQYTKGQMVDVKVHITANHKGHISFKICPVNDKMVKVTQDCLDMHPLQFDDGTYEHLVPGKAAVVMDVRLQLPADMVCEQCVIQWRYHTGNSWGCDATTNECGMGMGGQEEFYACADVRISDSLGIAPKNQLQTLLTPTTARSTTIGAKPASLTSGCSGFQGTGVWNGNDAMDFWCSSNCPDKCPENLCECADGSA